jgi:hypothetical protein
MHVHTNQFNPANLTTENIIKQHGEDEAEQHLRICW